MLVTDIAVYAALFAALGLVFVVHRVLSNYLQKREPRLTSFTKWTTKSVCHYVNKKTVTRRLEAAQAQIELL